MEISIDDLTNSALVADIKGEPIQVSDINTSAEGVRLPGAFMRSGDVRVYHMTEAGQKAYDSGVPFSRMEPGTHYVQVDVIPYRPTPEDLFFGRQEEKNPSTKTASRKMHNPALRARH